MYNCGKEARRGRGKGKGKRKEEKKALRPNSLENLLLIYRIQQMDVSPSIVTPHECISVLRRALDKGLFDHNRGRR